jgi:TrmH family RNA methyltransferase
MIESPQNEKLKLVRKLRDRKHREREGRFVTEGEDLLAAGLATGVRPRFVLVAAGSEIAIGAPDGATARAAAAAPAAEEVEAELLASVSSLGSGTRVIAVWDLPARVDLGAPVVYLHGVSDPGNVGAVVRSAHALLDATVALGPGCADAHGPKAVRGSMGSVFARPPMRAAVSETPGPRVGLVAHGGEGLDALAGAATICLGAEREGLPGEVIAECDRTVMIPLAGGAESLNVAAAAAIACERLAATGAARISSLAMPTEASPDA